MFIFWTEKSPWVSPNHLCISHVLDHASEQNNEEIIAEEIWTFKNVSA
jgi:hypothetical protein